MAEHFSRTRTCCVRRVQMGANRFSFNNNMAACLTGVQVKHQHLHTWHQRGAEDVIWTAVLPIPFDSLSTFLVDIAHCLGLSPTLRPHPLALRSKAEAFDREFQKVPLVLLASVLTGRWQSNDNYGPHSVSLELAPAANCALSPRRKEGFLEGQKKRAER